MKILKQKRFKWLLIGVAFSFLGPMGEWLLLSSFARSGEESLFLTYLYTEISALLAFGCFGFTLGIYADRIENLAMTNRLSGLYNRHYIVNRLSEMLKLQQRYHEHFALIMLDLDHFKQVNDNHGHLVGDQTIKAVTTTISAQLRDTDSPCRFGGEEFLILCPHTSLEEAFHLAERIRLQVIELGEDELGFSGSLTISAGVYEVDRNKHLSASEAMTLVDKALYSAKEAGRNQVVRG